MLSDTSGASVMKESDGSVETKASLDCNVHIKLIAISAVTEIYCGESGAA